MPALHFYTGSLELSSVPLALASSAISNLTHVVIQNDPKTMPHVTVRIGNALEQWIVLLPGVLVMVPIASLDALFFVASGGTAVVNWMAYTAIGR